MPPLKLYWSICETLLTDVAKKTHSQHRILKIKMSCHAIHMFERVRVLPSPGQSSVFNVSPS